MTLSHRAIVFSVMALVIELAWLFWLYTALNGPSGVLSPNTILILGAVANVSLIVFAGLSLHFGLATRLSDRRVHSLSQSVEHDRAILENAADVICSLDRDGRFIRVSQASSRVFGYSPQELEGRWLIELITEDGIAATTKCLKRSIEERVLIPFENKMRRKDGLVIQVLWSMYWSETDEALVCVAHEITQRKDAELKLRVSEARTRAILENIPIGIVILDENACLTSVNPAFESMLGYSFDELKSKIFTDFFAEADNRSQSILMRDLMGRQDGQSNRFQLLKGNGETLPVEVLVTNFESLDDKRFLALVIDVTERFKIEKMKREFIALITHELRTPLTSMQGFLTMLGDGVYGEMPELARKKTQTVNKTIDRLTGLINDILDMEKMEAGLFEFSFDVVSAEELIERSVETVREMAQGKNVAIEVPSSDLFVYADGDRLIQVLVNLLSNAVKYSKADTKVKVSILDVAPSWVEFRVEDQGKGIPEEFRSLIFERFIQVPGSGTEFKSSGLGLPICKAIIDQHGGSIGVESEPEKGSCFWFRVKKELISEKTTARIESR